MTDPASANPASECSGHEHDHDHEEEEKSGCNCGGLCGRREMLENLKKQPAEAVKNVEGSGLELTPEPAT